MTRRCLTILLLATLTLSLLMPLASAQYGPDAQASPEVLPWYERTAMDQNRNYRSDSLDSLRPLERANILIDLDRPPDWKDSALLNGMGYEVGNVFEWLQIVSLWNVPSWRIPALLELDGVVFIEQAYLPTFFSDVGSPAARARESTEYSPYTAWELGFSGAGVNVAIMDTGIDDDHPSFDGKWVGGADFSKPDTFLTPRDGTHDADDTRGHGTTCAGIATGTGAPDGTYMGAAPDAKLVDVRIGTAAGASPGEGPQNQYDAALLAIEWSNAYKDEAWTGQGEENAGIDIVSLSWGIPFDGSSDGSDAYSRGLDQLADAGVIPVVAAGNDGPGNDGFTGMGAASKVITVGATDDLNTINRTDDIIASYSSRGPRYDNGDGYAIDELKPEVSAPGSHIMQAEYTIRPLQSATGYSDRGSGTSYATPLVAGVVALMLEANPNLTTDVAREILKFTAERKENASAPEVDPFWNKDFGWGMVDAYRAVVVSLNTEDVSAIDVDLQNHVMNLTYENNRVRADGWVWHHRGENIDAVEVRIDGGEWIEVPIEDPAVDGAIYDEWHFSALTTGLTNSNHTLEARAVSGSMASLSEPMEFIVSGASTEFSLSGGALGMALIIIMCGIIGAAYYLTKAGYIKVPEEEAM